MIFVICCRIRDQNRTGVRCQVRFNNIAVPVIIINREVGLNVILLFKDPRDNSIIDRIAQN